MTAPTVFQLNTRGWGVVPCIGIRMGKRVVLVGTPDVEEKMASAGRHLPAWLESEDVIDQAEYFTALEQARKELA